MALQLYGNKIWKNNGYSSSSFTYIPIAIIGSGESGICMGAQLKQQLGFDQFRIFERQSGWGGTWWINRYPGVACDVPAAFYSFSFAQNKSWTSLYPPGPEIVKYLDGVCASYGLIDKIQLNTDVTDCSWNESEQVWDITIHNLVPGTGDLSSADRAELLEVGGQEAVYITTERIKAKTLISCVGGLVEPNAWPSGVEGKEDFKGEIFHSARWRSDLDFKDKNIVVVGSGCSAAQFVPELATTYGAKRITQVMRTPPWVVPKEVMPFGDRGLWIVAHVPGVAKALRLMIAAKSEYDWRFFKNGEFNVKEREKEEQRLLGFMKKMTPEKYHELLTPNYSIGCKRRIFDAQDGWYNSLNNEKVQLTSKQLVKVNANSVTLGKRTYPPGEKGEPEDEEIEVPADIIVLGNGFRTTKWFHPLKVVGRKGQTLQGVMDSRGGSQMYMGAAMDQFPNFFTIFGPNTATGHSSVILATENMVNYTIKLIEPVLAGDATTVEVLEKAERYWAKDIQSKLNDTVWHKGGCQSWYFDKKGWNSTVYP